MIWREGEYRIDWGRRILMRITLEDDGDYRRLAEKIDNEKIAVYEEYYDVDLEKWRLFDVNIVRTKDVDNLAAISQI